VLDRRAGLDQPGQQPVAEVLELAVGGGQLVQGVEQKVGRKANTSVATRVVGGSSGLWWKPLRRPSPATSTTAWRAASSAGTSEVTTVSPARRSRWRASTSP
jgi:hypothetical protein